MAHGRHSCRSSISARASRPPLATARNRVKLEAIGDVGLEYDQSVPLGDVAARNGGDVRVAASGDFAGGACRVIKIHRREVRMASEKGATLRERRRM